MKDFAKTNSISIVFLLISLAYVIKTKDSNPQCELNFTANSCSANHCEIVYFVQHGSGIVT